MGCPSSPPTERVDNPPTHPRVEDSLLKRRTRMYARKHLPAHPSSLYAPATPAPNVGSPYEGPNNGRDSQCELFEFGTG